MNRLLTLTVLIPLGVLAADAAMSPSAVARYQDATAKLQARAFGEAITTLNELAGEYPRTAEVFAARCSAQVSMQSFAGAEADCTYALTVKPDFPMAIYTLAMAQERLGKREAALASYRRYAAYDQTAAPYREQALARATALAPVPPPAAAPAPAPAPTTGKLVVYRNHYFAKITRITLVLDNRIVGDLGHDQYVEIEASVGEHILEARGSSANGYEAPRVFTRPFQLGAATVYANFDTAGGQVILQELPAAQARAEIQADCKKAYSRLITADSALAPAVAVAVAPPLIAGGAPECRMGSDGRQACGFNCRIGSDGVSACADSPNGVCAIGSNGRVTCSRVGGFGVAPAGPPPECKMSSRGVNTCGYNCRHGSRGDVYCASRPDGQCALNSDGTWSCP